MVQFRASVSVTGRNTPQMVNQGTYVNIDRITANQIPIEESEYGFHIR